MERAFDSEVRIAGVDFEKVRVPMIVTLFIVVVVVAKMSKLLFICYCFMSKFLLGVVTSIRTVVAAKSGVTKL